MVNPEEVEEPFECREIEVNGQSMHVPFLRVRSGEEQLILHPFNTLVRTFDEPDNIDHLEVRIEGNLQGIPMDEDTIEMFIEYNFPFRWDLHPDKPTIDWLAMLAMKHFDSGLGELLDGSE